MSPLQKLKCFSLFYYQPTVSDAYASVEYITFLSKAGFDPQFTHLVFFMHDTLFNGPYDNIICDEGVRSSTEITWISGPLLLMITFAFGLTGYLLPLAPDRGERDQGGLAIYRGGRALSAGSAISTADLY